MHRLIITARRSQLTTRGAELAAIAHAVFGSTAVENCTGVSGGAVVRLIVPAEPTRDEIAALEAAAKRDRLGIKSIRTQRVDDYVSARL